MTLAQYSPNLILEVGNVLGHSGLADPQLLCGSREGAQASERRQGPQPCFKSHNLSLYQDGQLCIFVLRTHTLRKWQKTLSGCPAQVPSSTARSSDLAHL